MEFNYTRTIDGEVYITLEGMKKLRESFFEDGDIERAKKCTLMINQMKNKRERK